MCGAASAKEYPMATGWAREGAVQDQIDDTVKDGVLRAKSRLREGPSATHCQQCGEPIPEARRVALAGVQLCIACQEKEDAAVKHFSGYNRRGSKDSQLR
jgi:phage/conjugal plasmid C-4 type zinc finger TraR family protein